jgi:4-alpha-glucanotransferase
MLSQNTKTAKDATPTKPAAKKVTTIPAVEKSADTITVHFQVAYRTAFGQNIFIAGNVPELGKGKEEKALQMKYMNEEYWDIQVKINKTSVPKKGLEYIYLIKNEDGYIEHSALYHLQLSEGMKHVYVVDAWNYEGFIQNAFSTKVFKILSQRLAEIDTKPAKKGTHQFKVIAPGLPAYESVFLLGSSTALGSWNEANVIMLTPEKEGVWSAVVSFSKTSEPVYYKYGIYDLDKNELVTYEEGENRILDETIANVKQAIVNDGFFHTN